MTHPISAESRLQPENPFTSLQIDCNQVLNTFESRYACEKCNKSRKFFCYTCFVAHPKLKQIIPHIKLPLKIDIIKHQREIDGKSTAAHAALLAPDDVKVYTYPDIPSYDNERVVLIFPSHTALEIPQLFDETDFEAIQSEFDRIEYPKGHNRGTLLKNLPTTTTQNHHQKQENHASSGAAGRLKGCLPITKAIFIDSTWNQSKGMYKDARIKRLPCVVLQNRISQFWRHQKGSPRWYLATIEAIHQFLLEIHINAFGVHPEYDGLKCCFVGDSLAKYSTHLSNGKDAYNGQYDNLLYFFEYMYKLIHTYYDHDKLYAYKRRMT